MWRPRDEGGTVTCIACGETLHRSAAREYDKHGDRWDRRDKEFEYLCKSCYRDLCHQPRDGLENVLVDAEAGTIDRAAFLSRFARAVEDEHGSIEE
jgi:hypothetical protein